MEPRKGNKRDFKKDTKRDARPDAKKDARPESKRDARPESKRDARPESKRDARPDSKREPRTDSRTDSRREGTPYRNEPEEINELIVYGRNAVLEGMKSGRSVDKLLILDQENQEGSIQKIIGQAKDMGLLVQYVAREKLDGLTNNGKHQGVLAFMAAHDYVELEVLFQKAEKRNEPPFFIILDGIEDPHNLGAIIRTANVAGVHGIIIPKNRAVSLTAIVAKTSAGAIEYTPVCKVVNLVRTMEEIKEKGVWITGADMKGTSMYEVDFKGGMAIVIGSEGKGLSRLVKEKCDYLASVPMKGDVDSLNASVAAGVLMYEALRQRQ